jgi:hypothetical protein
MADALIRTATLTANLATRTLSGLLVPFGEQGNTNLGKFTVEAGSLTIPRDPSVVTLNSDHDRESPIGRATLLTEEADGIHATFQFADTDEADEALLAYEAGTKSALSVEAKNLVIRAGKALSGLIFGAAHVGKGAFPSATLLAADVGVPADEVAIADAIVLEPVDGVLSLEASTIPESVVVTAEGSEAIFTPENPTESETLVATAVVPNTLTAAVSTEKRPLSVYEVGVLYAQRAQGRISDLEMSTALEGQNGNSLFAALSDVKFSGTGGLSQTISPTPQWLGQVWQATTYRQQVLPLFTHGDLNALTFAGFKWAVKPTGGDWAGNKADVPSNTITATPVTGTASRYAIGHDIAREFVDFPVEGFFESYAAAVTEDYARWSDNKVAAAAVAGATVLVGDALTTLPGVAGGTIGSAASAIIDGATAIITTGALPDFALVAPALWKQMAKMPTSNVIGYLNASLGLSEGDLDGFTIRPSASIAAGKVLVGAKSAVTVLELPGAPIRIDALDLARGGVDKAAFGYLGVNVNDALGLQLVTAATA